MAPRAFGALFALVAALAFAIAFAGGLVPTTIPGWWDGHPTVQGKELERKTIHVGLLEADGCNHAEVTKCEVVPTGHTLDVVGIAELAALGLGILTALIAAFSMWRMGDRRKFFGKLLLFEVVLIAGGAGAIFFHGPDLKFAMQVGIPVGVGLYAVMAGSVLAALGGVIAMRLEPEPLRLKSSEPRIPRQSQPAFDVRELLRDNQQPQPGMRVTHPHMLPPSPGGPLPGPQGPLGPMQQMAPPPGHQPLFESAPHLRPLYDMQNAGAAPNPLPPQLPTRAPTPVSRDAVGEMYGMPPPLEAPTPATRGAYAEGDNVAIRAPIAPYAAPYSPPRSIEETEDIERPSQPTLEPFPDPFDHAVPPPMPPPVEAAKAARVGTMPRAQRPSVPPPRMRGSKHPTIATAVPPMPVQPDPPEASTSVEVDAAAKARSRAAERPSDLALTVPVDRQSGGFDADESVIAPPVATYVPENFEELETRDATKFTEQELGMAATTTPHRHSAALPHRDMPLPHRDMPGSSTTPHRHSAALPHRDMPGSSTELGPLSPAMMRAPRAARADSEVPTEHKREERPPLREAKETNISIAGLEAATDTESNDQPIEPPTFAASAAQIAAVRRPDSEAPTAFAASKQPTEADAAAFAASPATEPAGAAFDEPGLPGPPAEAPTFFKGSPPAPRRSSPTTSPPPSVPRAPLPPPNASRATPPPPSMLRPPAMVHGAAPASPFPVAPSAATVAPPRPNRPSVPPPASRFPAFNARPTIPAIVPSNGIGKPPSNLEPSQSSNKSSTSSTPSPFATIPSPFGKKYDEAATRPARTNAPTDPQTTPATPAYEAARVGEAPTIAPQRPSEAPMRSVGATGFSQAASQDEAPTRAVGANGATNERERPAPLEPRPRWRASSEAPTSHAGTSNEDESRTFKSRGAGRDDLPQGASGEISAKPAIDEPGRGSGDASTASSRASGVHEAATVSPRRPTHRATTPPEIPMSTAPSSLPPPKKLPDASSGPTPACPQCEAPMAWVEEHLRFYCASCRMYF